MQLEDKDNTYVSWWPTGEDVDYTTEVPGEAVKSYHEDFLREQRKTPKRVDIIGLNEDAMATWYKEFSTTPNQTWKATGQNCSWTTAHTLIAGMTDPKFASLKQEMLQVRLWIPQYIHQYAIKIKKLLE